MLGAIAVLVLTPVLWILSHKYFRFIYFGNIGNAILKEILECFFISFFLVAVLGGVIVWLASILLPILGILAAVAGGVGVILLLCRIVRKSKGRKKHSEHGAGTADSVNDPSFTNKLDQTADVSAAASVMNVANQHESNRADDVIAPKTSDNVLPVSDEFGSITSEDDSIQVQVSGTIFCTYCGKKIKRTAKFCNFCGKENLYIS